VVAMEGRFHFYEGYSLRQITLPVRVMKALGCEVLIVSNACGGLNPQFAKGDLMLIEDHINLLADNPLIGPNDERLGPRFPDMCAPYDRDLLARARRIALEEKIVCHQGVFVAVSGPNLETRAEYRFLRGIGADVVGMSTVPEILVAVHSGLRSLGLSVITDMCLPDALEPVKVEKIIAVANEAEKKLRVLVRRVIEEL
jgi:purine-nucleoside phosphorylase